MFIKRLDEAKSYEAPNHHGVHGLRLQGFEAGSSEKFWVGLSRILPGGGAGPDASPFEKVYVLLSGELTVKTAGKSHILKTLDCCQRGARDHQPHQLGDLDDRDHALPGEDMSTEWLSNPASLFDIRGNSAIVVGATGSFGNLASRVLAGAGARLTLAASRTDELTTVAEECAALGAEVETVARRTNSEADAEAVAAAAQARFGGIDILVVASGVNDVVAAVDMSQERFEKVMQANVTGAWLMARAAGKRLIAQNRGGKVVLTSSARGLLGHPAGYSAYCASKSAVDGITKALGCEWGKHAITVNAIAPTVFRSPLTAWMFEDNDKARTARTGFLARVPIGRLGAAVSVFTGLGFLYRAHPLCRWWVYGRLAVSSAPQAMLPAGPGASA